MHRTKMFVWSIQRIWLEMLKWMGSAHDWPSFLTPSRWSWVRDYKFGFSAFVRICVYHFVEWFCHSFKRFHNFTNCFTPHSSQLDSHRRQHWFNFFSFSFCFRTLVYDAAGYYAGSIYAGNNIRHGDSQLCRELNDGYNFNEYRTKYGATPTIYEDIQSYLVPSAVLPFRVRLVNARYKSVIESSPFHAYIVHQTVCMPMSCTHDDLMQVMSYANVSHLRNSFAMKNSELLDVRILRQSYELHMDVAFYWIV